MLDARLISGLLRSNQLEHSGVLIFSNDRKITRRKPRSQLEVMPGRYGESTIARILAIHAILLRRHNCLGAMPGGGFSHCPPHHASVRKPSSGGQYLAAGRRHPLRRVNRMQVRHMTTTRSGTMPGMVGYIAILLIVACVFGPALIQDKGGPFQRYAQYVLVAD
jgi:hypothetical protein